MKIHGLLIMLIKLTIRKLETRIFLICKKTKKGFRTDHFNTKLDIGGMKSLSKEK